RDARLTAVTWALNRGPTDESLDCSLALVHDRVRLSGWATNAGQCPAVLGDSKRVNRDWLPIDDHRHRETASAHLRDPAALEFRWLAVRTDDGIVAAIEVGLTLCPS